MNSHLRATDSIRSTLRGGQRDREDEAREAGARADVADRPRRLERRDLEAGEASRRRGLARPRSGSRTELSERGSAASSSRTVSSCARASGPSSVEPPPRRGSARPSGSAHWSSSSPFTSGATITLRSGSSPSLKVSTSGALGEVVVDDLALGRRHRLELDLLAGLERTLGGAVGLALEQLAAALAVAGGVDDHALAVDRAALGRAVADELDRVDRLAAAADQAARRPPRRSCR